MKTRAWDGKKFVESFYIDQYGKAYVHEQDYGASINSPRLMLRRPLTISEYIDIKDSDGVEMCEGDLVTDGFHTGVVERDGVEWCWAGFYSINSALTYSNHCFKIIGNIYESPELLV